MSTAVLIRRARNIVNRPPGKRSLRSDIQGLRAFAVIVVILDHLLGWPSGGFVGVDIFFVISGFVITQSLLREHERSGRISIIGFYKRRIKRIVPASLATLLFTLIVAYFIFSQSRFLTTVWDVLWAVFFSANWRMNSVGTDYFQSGGPVSPLQHFWSLAVEEQFYFVWPFVMMAALLAFGRVHRSSNGGRLAVGIAISVICVASFLWALVETSSNPTTAYFSTFTRAWELGAGALLAVLAPALAQLPVRLRPVLAWLGVAGMVASIFVMNTATPFPAPSAALPVLSAVLFILAGTGASQHDYLAPFTNRVSNYLGDISYSLYLVHFPVIILAGTFLDVRQPLPSFLILGAVLACAMYSYHLLEDPIRKSTWLEKGGSRNNGTTTVGSPAYVGTALSLLAVVTAGMCVAALQVHTPTTKAAMKLSTPRPTVVAPVSTASAEPPLGRAGKQLEAQVTAAIAATEWPDLSPSMDDVIAGPQVPDDVSRCGGIGPIIETNCTWGDPSAPKTAVIIGDSVALTYVTALRGVFKDRPDWKLSTYAAFGCSFTDTLISNADANIVEGCPAKKEEAVAAINRLQPDIVFITNTYEPRMDLETKSELTPTQWSQSTQVFVESFNASAKKVVFLSPPPSDVDVKACYDRVSIPGDCVGQVTGQWHSIASVEGAIAKRVGGAWVDSSRLFCDSRDLCPSFVGTTPTKMDKVHMTAEYAHKIAPALAEELALHKLL